MPVISISELPSFRFFIICDSVWRAPARLRLTKKLAVKENVRKVNFWGEERRASRGAGVFECKRPEAAIFPA